MEQLFSKIELLQNSASADEIERHLHACDRLFVPRLSSRVDIPSYASKIFKHAYRCEAWHHHHLIGMVAAYLNDFENKTGFITSVSIERAYQGRGLARRLLQQCIDAAKDHSILQLKLEVNSSNLPAIKLYRDFGFESERAEGDIIKMIKKI
ncbi:MAG: GNAT family N-acetyltransferase [Cyclobacteriaceae bacterium]|nr:GNAT family N-acetyltransferase [Cyclobacteriaceae bacterium]